MKALLSIVALPFLFVCAEGVAKGFNLKHRAGWLYVFCGFAIGFLGGFAFADLLSAMKYGCLFAFIVIFAGSYMEMIKNRFGG